MGAFFRVLLLVVLLNLFVNHIHAYNIYRSAKTAAMGGGILLPAAPLAPGGHYGPANANMLGARAADFRDVNGAKPALANANVNAKDGATNEYQGMSTSETICELFHSLRPLGFGGGAHAKVVAWTMDTANLGGANLAAVKDGGQHGLPPGHVTVHTTHNPAADYQQIVDDIVSTAAHWATVQPGHGPNADRECVQGAQVFYVSAPADAVHANLIDPPLLGVDPVDPLNGGVAGVYNGYPIARRSPCYLPHGSRPAAWGGGSANSIWSLGANSLPSAKLGAYFSASNQHRGKLHPLVQYSAAKVAAYAKALAFVKVALPVRPADDLCAPQAPHTLTYASPQVYTQNVGIGALDFNAVNFFPGTETDNAHADLFVKPSAPVFTVNPNLPAGLALHAGTGQITGTPTAVTAGAVYTITATNVIGHTSFQLHITVNAPAGFVEMGSRVRNKASASASAAASRLQVLRNREDRKRSLHRRA